MPLGLSNLMNMKLLEKGTSLRKKKKFEMWIICIVTVVLLITFYELVLNSKNSENLSHEQWVEKKLPSILAAANPHNISKFNGEKLVHLDLKGAPPRISYLKYLFSYFKGMGATGILMEYEDMFPFSEALDKADFSYSKSDIELILILAKFNGLSVIPLIQTFGHLEFLLKRDKFKAYREVPQYPQVVCPTYENTSKLIQTMIDEVLKLHPEAKYIHIGCDEVYYIGKCDKCKEWKRKHGWGDQHLLLNHIKTTAKYIKEKHKGVRPIIWGDTVQNVEDDLVKKFEIHKLVDIMVWYYRPDVVQHFGRNFLMRCARLFRAIWIAGAFKGATGADQMVTDAKYHLENLRGWMRIVAEWKGMITFKGIALTGWQRYDHFAVLCELLPVAVPSLILQLQYLGNIAENIDEKTMLNILQCDGPLTYSPHELQFKVTTVCSFPGSQAYKEITNFFVLIESIKRNNPFRSANGWFSAYNVINKYSSPAQVENFFREFPVEKYKAEVESAAIVLSERLGEIYEDHTVEEWLLTHVTPLRIRLECLTRNKNNLMNQNVWPRRPLPTKKISPWSSVDSLCEDNEYFCGLISI